MKLILFFTRGISLKVWLDKGLFDREKLIYEEHLTKGNLKKVYWLTYGSEDKKIAESLKDQNRLNKNIEICPMPNFFNIPKVGSYLYALFVLFNYRKIFKECDILKTNQMTGSWNALLAKWLFNKPLLLRTGFTQSIFLIKQKKNPIKIYFSKLNERLMYNNCDHATIGSQKDKDYICDSYGIDPSKITVLYNYIDISLFRDLGLKRENKIIFVGRLSAQKNLFNLIEALSKTDLVLDIYGQGELQEELQKFSLEKNAKVNFKGVISNKDLPNILNQYKYYVLASYYEGMPKTLLEAMACGCICLGTNVEGINEVIKDEYNGFLINGTDAKALSSVLVQLPNLLKSHDSISSNGIQTIKNKFSLNRIIEEEYRIMKNIV